MPSYVLADPCHAAPCATMPYRRARPASSLPWGTVIVLTGLLMLAGVFSAARPAFAQTPLDCPLPVGVTPPAAPRVTAQQVEDGSASLTDFALAARDHFVSGLQERTRQQFAYGRCLIRQEGSPWRSGSTYLVRLTPDGRVYDHAKDMSLSGRLLTPVIYGAILHTLGISRAALTDPAAVLAAFTPAAAGDGGPFNVPDVPGASGYATVYIGVGLQRPFVLLAGFDLSESHLVPIRDEAIDYGDPPITARDVVDRTTLKAFVTAAGEYIVELLESGDLAAQSKSRIALRDPNGPWRHGPVYLAMMERVSKQILFHGGFPNRFEYRRGGIARDIATGELIVDQLIRAAESSPEGGFWEYYFDNPADAFDSAEVPKVGYARVFSGQIPLPDGSTPPIDFIINSGFYPRAGAVGLRGVLENPGPDSFQSGVGALWGWVCDAAMVEIEIETAQGAVEPYRAAYGMERLDTQETCGDTDNGFVLLVNWNRLGAGEHRVTALVDGLELGQATVQVTTVGEGAEEEFLRGVEGECVAEDFPYMGQRTRLEWQQESQNFVITDVE